MRLLLRAFVLLAVLGAWAASVSSAATLDLTGDVGAAIAAGNSGTSVYSGGAAFGDVTFSANPSASDLTHAAGSGLGIDCNGYTIACLVDKPNQLDTGEILRISFERPLLVTSVDLRNLFGTDLAYGCFSIHLEEGGAVAGAGFAIGFDSDDAGANGALTLAINRWASSIIVASDSRYFSAFSLAGISIDDLAGAALPPPSSSPIPEPSSVILLLIGGALVATQVRGRI